MHDGSMDLTFRGFSLPARMHSRDGTVVVVCPCMGKHVMSAAAVICMFVE